MSAPVLPLKKPVTVPKGLAHRRCHRAIEAAAIRAAHRIAPLWPLKHFVAVNPYLGIADLPFNHAAKLMAEVAGTRLTMPRQFYGDAIKEGRIADQDLAAALAEAPPGVDLPPDVANLKKIAFTVPSQSPCQRVPTISSVATAVTGRDWSRLMTERVATWAAAYFDEGQAPWRSPWRHLPLFAAWRSEAALDRTPEVMGLAGFRSFVRQLPETASQAIASAIERLGVPQEQLADYFHRLLMQLGGWAGYARYLGWGQELRGEHDGRVLELLAVLLSWECAMHDAFAPNGISEAWADAWIAYLAAEIAETRRSPLEIDLVLQAAYEKAWQRQILPRLSRPYKQPLAQRKSFQAAFCIDVRSEVYRRALEAIDPQAETIGFAGFFGFAIEYLPLGFERGGARCPALLAPKFVVREQLSDGDAEQEQWVTRLRLRRLQAVKAWKAFRTAAVASFGFVETLGLGYAAKLVTDSLGITRAVPASSSQGLRRGVRLKPQLEKQQLGDRQTGLTSDQQLAAAESLLRAMSTTERFARLFLLVGHGSTTTNNPHASSLDCGACGGHSGEANARVAAAVLNQPDVRRGLAAKNLVIPDDTVFLGCLHDTTTDQVTIFDEQAVPASHAADLLRVKERLAAAAQRARAERAPTLGIGAHQAIDAAVIARSRDWSQVRPEWGLAGCALFVAAPRSRTEGLDLGGRSFLHSYDWRTDKGFATLELIMTAPMVVASWISLQYYASTVDNRTFGSGNKVLHNVVGSLGVLEGNGGDLRAGLPWQSVHNGQRWIHEPLRLTVWIEAPTAAINNVIARHDPVRQLVDNRWLHLFAISSCGTGSEQYVGGLTWRRLAAAATHAPAVPKAAVDGAGAIAASSTHHVTGR